MYLGVYSLRHVLSCRLFIVGDKYLPGETWLCISPNFMSSGEYTDCIISDEQCPETNRLQLARPCGFIAWNSPCECKQVMHPQGEGNFEFHTSPILILYGKHKTSIVFQ